VFQDASDRKLVSRLVSSLNGKQGKPQGQTAIYPSPAIEPPDAKSRPFFLKKVKISHFSILFKINNHRHYQEISRLISQ